MIFEFEKSFTRDFRKVKSITLAKEILASVDDIAKAESIKEIHNLKKIRGYKNAYRIRTGDYRIGIIINEEKVIFVPFAHRKEIYKTFP